MCYHSDDSLKWPGYNSVFEKCFYCFIVMDQTSRPLNIPPEFLLYAEKHTIFELFQVK